MRWFVVFLLLANLVLYLWVAYGESPRPVHDLPPPDIGRLRLLHEAEPPALAEPLAVGNPATGASPGAAWSAAGEMGPGGGDGFEPVDAGAQIPPAGPAVAVESAAETAVAAVPVPEPGPAPSPAPAAPGFAQQIPPQAVVEVPAGELAVGQPDSGPAPREQPVAVPEPVVVDAPLPEPKDAPEAAVEPMPVDAVPPAGGSVDAATPAEPAAPAVGEAAAESCIRIGPLTAEEAQAVRSNVGVAARVVGEERREIAVVDGYYVLIPPLASRQQGNSKLEELSAAGVKDTWLFRSGELRNAISLGYFKREASAQRHAETIRGLGFDAEVREKPVQAERLWLLFAAPATPDSRVVTDPVPEGASIEPGDCPAQ